MSTHTSGPWGRAPSGDLGRILGPGSERESFSKRLICRVSLAYKDSDTWDANCRLIAAAPDMLAILKALVHPDVEAIVYFVPSDSWAQKLKDDVRAAIAKAEGQPRATPHRQHEENQ